MRRALFAGAGTLAVAGLTLAAAQPVPVRHAPATDHRGPTEEPLRDPALHTGTLPNGLRYYVRANAMPAYRAELRLVVNAGSVLEDPDQRGFAHFLEHMAFEGTRHFPGRSLIDFLETSGMRFGADLNAQTTFDETVYEVTLPTDVPGTLERGLTALEDWASGGITLDSAAVVAQRGIVMAEWRFRLPDTAAQRVAAHYDTLLFRGTPYLSRPPIGDTALIEAAEPGPIARFYHDWYRPDLLAVVAVGDFDATAVEREIRARFGRIPEPAHPRPRPDPEPVRSRTPVVDVYRARRVSPFADLMWPAPAAPSDVRAAERQRLVWDLLLGAVGRSLLRIRERPSRPFITAAVERRDLVRRLDLVSVQVVAWPDSLERAMASVVAEIGRVAQHGLPPATLELRKAAMLRRLEHEAAGAAARSSRWYADDYARHFLTGQGLLISAAQELALARAILPAITFRDVARAARFWRDGAGERVFIGIPAFAHVQPPSRKIVLALMDSVAQAKLPAETALAGSGGPLLPRPPEPGRIVAERVDSASGITEWTLSNGARVLFKPTQNDPDAFLMKAWGPGGFSAMPDSLFYSPGRMVAKIMTEASGLGALDRDALARGLTTNAVRSLRVAIGYAGQSIALGGSPRDLETLFQLMYLQFTAPKLDSAVLDSWQSLARYEPTPYSINDAFNATFARGNPRLMPVSTVMAPLVTVPEAVAVYRDRFGNAGEFTFGLVGAATPDEVRPLVERYLASLPSTGRQDRAIAPDVRPFASAVDAQQRVLELPKAVTLLVFDGPFPAAPDSFLLARRQLGLIVTILSGRLRLRLREELGATYSPAVAAYTYGLPDEHYRVFIAFDAAPRRMKALNQAVDAILDSLRKWGADSAELDRGALVERRQLETALQDDAFWLHEMQTYDGLQVPMDRLAVPETGWHPSPAAFRAAVERYLPADVYIHITAMPKDSTLYTSPDTARASG